MLRKKALIALAITAVLVVPGSVFAATSNVAVAKNIRGFLGIDTSKLSEQQKADAKVFNQKTADLQKDFINKMIANGSITKEQGDAEIKSIDDKLKNGGDFGLLGGFGRGNKAGERKEGFGFEGVDLSKLTDAQKAQIIASNKEVTVLQKGLIDKMVASKLITNDQGLAAKKGIDAMISNTETKGLSNKNSMFVMGMGGFNCLGIKGVDLSKMTEQQKTDLKDFTTKVADIQKKMINDMVTSNAMTKEQGDAAISRIDNIVKNGGANSFLPGLEKGKGGFGRDMRGGIGNSGKHGAPRVPNNSTSNNSATPQV